MTYVLKNTAEKPEARVFMELLIPDSAEVLLSYEHANWKEYAALTRNIIRKRDGILSGLHDEFGYLEMDSFFRAFGSRCESAGRAVPGHRPKGNQ